MTLRLRLFLVFGALVALLVVAQYLLLRALTADLEAEVDRVAVFVGRSVASVLEQEIASDGAADSTRTATAYMFKVGDDAPVASSEPILETVRGTDDGRVRLERRFVHKVPGPDGRPQILQVEIEHELDGGAHARDGAERILWLGGPDLDARVPIPSGGLRDRLASVRRNMLVASIALLVVGLVAVAAVARRVAAPLRRLADASAAVGAGALGTRVDTDASDREVRRVLEEFNAMSERLAALDAETRRLAADRHLAEIGEVARGLAHSLRNPLNALGLTVDELLELSHDEHAIDGTSRDEVAATARRQIRRLDRIVRTFLVFSSHDDASLEALPVDVEELVHDVALEALQDAGGRVRVEVGHEAPLDATLSAVPAELRAAVQALATNAVEASPDGGRVVLRLERRPLERDEPGARLRLTIDDDGPGVADSLRDRLFEPHTTTKAHGAGMGLFLAHRLAVHRYGGSLRLVDRDGGGTRAELLLGDRLGDRLGDDDRGSDGR